MKNPVFTGLCTALVTPFLDGRVNYPLAQQLVARQLEAGVKTLVLFGTTGESPTLEDEEKLELLRRIRAQVGTGCTLIAGTGSNSTEHTVALSREAEAAGADALLVVAPYYNRPTADGLMAHYIAVAHAVSVPVILYNVPSRTGCDIPVEVCRRLAAIPNIAGIKEATTDVRKLGRIRAQCPPDFTLWAGNDDMAVASIALGAKGLISAAANALPRELQALTQAALDGDFDTAAALNAQLVPAFEALFCETNPVAVKAALACQGLDCGKCRLPLAGPTAENRKKVEAFFRQ